MNRQIGNLGFFNSLSPSIKLISSITVLGYLLSYSETAVLVSYACPKRDLQQSKPQGCGAVSRGWRLEVDSMTITNNFLSFLGAICNSRESSAVDFCNMDCIYFLLSGDPHLGSDNRHCVCDIVLKIDRATLGSNPGLDVLRRRQLQRRGSLVALLLGTLRHHQEH